MMQMTHGRQQQRSETPKKQQLYTTRPLPESDDERQSHPINVEADDWSDKRNMKGPTGDAGGT